MSEDTTRVILAELKGSIEARWEQSDKLRIEDTRRAEIREQNTNDKFKMLFDTFKELPCKTNSEKIKQIERDEKKRVWAVRLALTTVVGWVGLFFKYIFEVGD